MAVGPTESMGSGTLRFTPQQVSIATRTIDLFNRLLRGVSLATPNPSAAIPPAGDAEGVTDASPGIGSRIDFEA